MSESLINLAIFYIKANNKMTLKVILFCCKVQFLRVENVIKDEWKF